MPNLQTHLASDQPTTCPTCGLRTEIILDLSHTNNQTQVHKCPNISCNYEFFLEFEKEQES